MAFPVTFINAIMEKNRMKLSVSGRIILISVVGVIASSVIILCISTIMMNRLLTRTIYDDMNSMQAIVENMVDDEESQLRKTIRILVTMPRFVDAMYERDLDIILENARTIKNQFEYDLVTITDAQGIVLARGHSDMAMDDISNRPMMAAALQGEISSGVYYDATALVPFSIRAFSPIYKDGAFVGVLSIGINVASEAYVDHIQRITNMNFSVFYGETRYMTSLADESGNRLAGTVHDDAQIADRVLNGGETVIEQYDILGEPNIAAIWPIFDSDSNRIIGMWALSYSLTDQNRETLNVLIIVILCSLGIILITIITASRYGRLIARPIHKVTDYAIAVADGDLDASLDIQSIDIKNSYEAELLVGALKTMVTTLKDRIQEIEQKRIEADEANKSKSSFLANMSHEIRTPMNVILGLTEILMRDKNLEKTVHEELVAIYSSGDMLLNIINDILDLSKIEAGKLELIPEHYDLASLINDTVVVNLMRVESKQLEFKLRVDENIPATMIGDELRIKQILNNLLSNAFKYTERGEVILSFSVENEEELKLVFSVSDTGSGMSEEEIEVIFDKYTRFQHESTRKISGTGLGMSITQNLVQMMNGEILINSELGKGTLLTVRLPQGETGAGELGSELSEKLENFRVSGIRQLMKSSIVCEPMPYGSILIVDDVESNLFVAKGLLTPYGLKIETVTSGLKAIDKIKDGKIYDIIFMDHMMPKMDGIEATKIIRELGYKEPIVALTANAVVGQMDIFLKNGFDDFISKPIDVRYMNTVLKKLIRDKQPPEVIEAALEQKRKASLSQIADEPVINTVSPHLAELFIIDATNSINAIEKINKNAEDYNDEEMRQYITSTHAMKTALLNVNEPELSSFASRLEQAGLNNSTGTISDETPVFLRRLRTIMAKLKLPEIDIDDELTDVDYKLLKEQLQRIKEACEVFDKRTAKSAIVELRRTRWNADVNSLLSTMAEHLISGDLNMVISTADVINEITSNPPV